MWLPLNCIQSKHTGRGPQSADSYFQRDLQSVRKHILKSPGELSVSTVTLPAVIHATYAFAKRKPEKIRLAGIQTLTSAIRVQRSNQLASQRSGLESRQALFFQAFFSQLHKLR